MTEVNGEDVGMPWTDHVLTYGCRCGGDVDVLAAVDEHGRYVVDYGECVRCGKKHILPPEDFAKFAAEHCERKVRK